MPTALYFQDDLLAHYSFAGGSLVNEGDGQSATIYEDDQKSNTNLNTTTGRDGGVALLLDASKNQSLLLEDVAGGIAADSDRTLCMWAKVFEWNGARFFEYGDIGHLFGVGVTDGATGFTFYFDPGKPSDEQRGEEVEAMVGDSTAWHHYCATVEKGIACDSPCTSAGESCGTGKFCDYSDGDTGTCKECPLFNDAAACPGANTTHTGEYACANCCFYSYSYSYSYAPARRRLRYGPCRPLYEDSACPVPSQ